MKVDFYFDDEPIPGYGTNQNPELIEVNRTIQEKVNEKIIEIPCVPTKEMTVDISAFSEVFGFSKKEMKWIEDCHQYYSINDIIIRPTHLEVYLENA